ncbi:MAG: glutaredoxin 3 [Legionellales bacterium]|nr:glutaredoxin 3 [Legionellales bacterium]|tara:strand:+ start:190 stop:441 length:252 start_codon:yes stop_codon:yes gene_type:complete
MAKVEIYTADYCPFCHRAKALLDAKGVKYQEYPVENDPDKRAEMEQRSARRTVPQIFIDGQSIGGCDDLHALDANKQLDELLK